MRLNIHHFVVISVLTHAALLAAWVAPHVQPIRISASESSAPALQVALQPEPKLARPKLVRHISHSTKPRPHRISPQPQPVRPQPDQASQPVTRHQPPPVTTTHAAALQAQLRRNEIRDRVLSRIRTDLQQYFVYPLLAQRRGWQGRVLLAFSVESNGKIRNIHVAAGSGFPVLDTSAVDALSRVHHLYPDDNSLPGTSLDLQLPVIFQLQGG